MPERLEHPYFVHVDNLPGVDFNREIIEPGTNDGYPDGAIGIRVDDDFWAVAALPYSYRDRPLAEIVAEFWPHYAAEAILCPDSGTVEQELYWSRNHVASVERANDRLSRELLKARDEIARLRIGRPLLKERVRDRVEAQTSYFVRQYEHLLTATAHVFEAEDVRKGVCRLCGLLHSDRVHARHWIERRAQGVDPHFSIAMEYPDPAENGALSPSEASACTPAPDTLKNTPQSTKGVETEER